LNVEAKETKNCQAEEEEKKQEDVAQYREYQIQGDE